MPRPKPPEPLKPRAIRLSDTQWDRFTNLGGIEWLRATIERSRGGVTAEKIKRNRRIRIDRAGGMLINDIAAKHHISWRTVLRVLE